MGFFDNVASIKIDNKNVQSIYEGDKLIWPLIRPSYFETFTISSTNIYVQDSITISFRLCGMNNDDILKNQPVKIYDGSTLLTTQNTVDGTGLTTYTYTIPNAGTHNIKLVFEGNDDYKEVTSSIITVTVNKSNTSISWTSSSYTGVIGNSIGTVTVKDRSNRAVNGVTVEFYQGNTKLKTTTTNSNGQCSGPSFSSTGTYTVSAKVVADSNYNASTSGNASITVNKKNSNLSWWIDMPNSWNINVGDSIIVSTNSDLPKGYSIKFYNNNTLLETFITPITGMIYHQTITPIESGTIKAVFEGDSTYNSATITKNITINKITPTLTLTLSADTITVGQSVTANLTSNVSIGPDYLAVYVDGVRYSNMYVYDKEGHVTINNLSGGSHTITVTSNDTETHEAVSVSKTITVNKYETRFDDYISANTVTGYLQYKNGNNEWIGLPNQSFSLTYKSSPSSSSRIKTITTDSNGYFSLTTEESSIFSIQYNYAGNDKYKSCEQESL